MKIKDANIVSKIFIIFKKPKIIIFIFIKTPLMFGLVASVISIMVALEKLDNKKLI